MNFRPRFLPALAACLGFVLASSPVFSQNEKAARKSSKKLPSPSAESLNSGLSATNSVNGIDPTNKQFYQDIIRALSERYADPAVLKTRKIDQAAVQGMLESLAGSARILTPDMVVAKPASSKRPAINSMSTINPFIGYLRLERIEKDTATQLETEVQKLLKEQHVMGIILDLRFASGSNYAQVPDLASVFLAQPKPLFTIQRGSTSQNFTSTPPTSPTDTPMVVLVNHDTREAAETLAAVLQDQGRALVIGNSMTAGQAFETSDIKLSNGQILRLATGKISLAKGGSFFLKGTQPNVSVTFDSKAEKEIFELPFEPPDQHDTIRFYSEAILTGRNTAPKYTKEKKDPPDPSSNRDLVLLRAIDLIKTIYALDLSSDFNRLTGNKT